MSIGHNRKDNGGIEKTIITDVYLSPDNQGQCIKKCSLLQSGNLKARDR